jgi:hypothetical protein
MYVCVSLPVTRSSKIPYSHDSFSLFPKIGNHVLTIAWEFSNSTLLKENPTTERGHADNMFVLGTYILTVSARRKIKAAAASAIVYRVDLTRGEF